MPVVLLEGPDESGKTTLAMLLIRQLMEAGIQVQYRKSPAGKDEVWFSYYDTYLSDLASVKNHSGPVFILDRTPEISESVYGTVRGKIRGSGLICQVDEWLRKDIFMVFCTAPKTLDKDHTDTFGNVITRDKHHDIVALYNVIAYNLRQAVFRNPDSRMQVVGYSYPKWKSYIRLCYLLQEHLSKSLPHLSGQIGEALGNPTSDEWFLTKETLLALKEEYKWMVG